MQFEKLTIMREVGAEGKIFHQILEMQARAGQGEQLDNYPPAHFQIQWKRTGASFKMATDACGAYLRLQDAIFLHIEAILKPIEHYKLKLFK